MSPVVIDKDVLGGKPRINGTRVSVGTIVSYLINGYDYKDIRRDYPSLTKTQVDHAKKYYLNHPDRLLNGKKI